MASVGIIANPTSGKDIRRLVGQALVIGSREKVNIIKRVLIGLHSVGVHEVFIMPDRLGIGEKSIQDLNHRFPQVVEKVKILDLDLQDSSEDTLQAALMMKEIGAQAIITLGGDGTVRVAAKGAGDIPILPISTGTNNVLPKFIEGTVAGLAAGRFACSDPAQRQTFVKRQKKINIYINGKLRDIALVDLVLIAGSHIGSKAVWESDKLFQVAATQGSLINIGFSSIIGNFKTIYPEDPFGCIATLRNKSKYDYQVSAVIGPGMIENFKLSDVKTMSPGKRYRILSKRQAVIALDGEREIVLNENDKAEIELSLEGPYFLDHKKILELL